MLEHLGTPFNRAQHSMLYNNYNWWGSTLNTFFFHTTAKSTFNIEVPFECLFRIVFIWVQNIISSYWLYRKDICLSNVVNFKCINSANIVVFVAYGVRRPDSDQVQFFLRESWRVHFHIPHRLWMWVKITNIHSISHEQRLTVSIISYNENNFIDIRGILRNNIY